MLQFTPPGLYDASITLLRAIGDTYAHHKGQRIPVIAYRSETRGPNTKKRASATIQPFIEMALYKPDDIPPAFRRWYLSSPFAVAIPEAVWRICPAHLLDFAEDGSTIVLKERWDGPAIRPPSLPL